ncbi:hypothetical protein OWR29_37445 [Actinoplanes sp. Pm04-4]|uniref:Uncharacterized protein n=1 Tax=Paractinoplanes pyxinae TaxID=2997416 RepID=A0ABT4BB28_9ACTN|nr:hypothetical protein [Actinoplanes pyxinae]MCY1143721.1 hypothetical protein [Actinoplanes pyxinae]
MVSGTVVGSIPVGGVATGDGSTHTSAAPLYGFGGPMRTTIATTSLFTPPQPDRSNRRHPAESMALLTATVYLAGTYGIEIRPVEHAAH